MFKVTLSSDGIVQSIIQGEKSIQITVGELNIHIETLEKKEFLKIPKENEPLQENVFLKQGLATRGVMDEKIDQVALNMKMLPEELQQLKNKNPKKDKVHKLPIRDPIYKNHYDFFMLGAGESIKKKLKSVRTAQLRILYTLLYLCGLRLHEVKKLTKEDLFLAIQTAEFNIFHPKTTLSRKYVLPESGKKILEQLLPEIELIFDEYGFQFLGNSKPFSETTFSTFHFFKFVNEDMRKICEKEGMLENFTSDSFRVGYIAKLLRTVPIQKVASIVGHKDIQSTMSYQRYVIDKDEIQRVLKDSFNEN